MASGLSQAHVCERLVGHARGGKHNSAKLGHGDYDMLFGHYRTLMTKEDAEKIFSLTPEIVSRADKAS